MSGGEPVPYLSPADVVAGVRLFEARHPPDAGPFDCTLKMYAAGLTVLGEFFGGDWTASRVAPRRGTGATFVHPERQNPLDSFKHQDRVAMLAEHLVNLQNVQGFQFCLKEIWTDDIESGLAKLIPAGMLQRRDIPFRFVVPSQRLGEDYDAQAIIGTAAVPIEMKAKVEGTHPSPQSIVNSLKRARKQMPKDTPNLVFLRVPEAWGETPEGQEAIKAGLEKAFRNSGSLALVAVHWEKWGEVPTPGEPGGAERRVRLLLVPNKEARIGLSAIQSALADSRAPGPWLSFQELLCS